MAKTNKTEDSFARLTEEAVYEIVAQEMQNGVRREGLWVKAYAEAGGDENKANVLYIELRKQSVIDEHIVQAELKEREEEALKRKREEEEDADRRDQELIARAAKRAQGFDGLPESEKKWAVAAVIFGGIFLVMALLGELGK